jgi:hypothetical protein
MKLYEIDAQIEALLNASVDRETGEIDEAAMEELAALEVARDEKALAVAAYIIGQEAEAEAVKAQARKLTERAAKHERHAERLRLYLAAHLPVGTKLRDDRVEIGWRKSTAVEVDEGAADRLPSGLLRISVSPDKTAIRKVLDAGHEVEGCRLVQRTALVVK